VTAPQGSAESIELVQRGLGAKDPKARKAARENLEQLLGAEPPDPALAVFLSASKDSRLIKASFSLWSRLGGGPARLQAMVALMGHERDDIRHGALGSLVFEYGRPEAASRVAPYLRRLLADPSCPVRMEAYGYLMQVHKTLGLQHEGLISAALRDPCPAVRIQGLERAQDTQGPISDAHAAVVLSLAKSSPYPLERCKAFGVLARIRHPEAEATLSKGLALAAGTTLLVSFRAKRVGSLSLGVKESLPECAAKSLDLLGGDVPKAASAKERVFAHRAAMARKRLVALPPKKPCLSERDCSRDGEVCLHLACTPLADAKEAFFSHRKAERCQSRAHRGSFHNEQPAHTVRLGFGLDPLGPFRIQLHLAKIEPEDYAKRTKAQDAEPCGQ
jgi:hypothetical protein